MYLSACVAVFLGSVFELPLASAFLIDFYSIAPTHSSHSSHHCLSYSSYNELLNLIHDDNCMNVDLVFQHLEDLNNQVGVYCRMKVINALSDHFGSHPYIPQKCSCTGHYRLQIYHIGSGDGVTDIRDHCLRIDNSYRDLYHQFFQSQGSNGNNIACRTHHSVWNYLRHISTATYDNNSCQKDIIYHLSYAFEKHPDHCVCTANSQQTSGQHTHDPQGHTTDPCSQYSSYNRLLDLGNTNDCLSANSVWHYLDDLQVKSSECRKKIQLHMANKYQHATSQNNNGCICHMRAALKNHEIHRLNNGSLIECRDHTSGSFYQDIDHRLFSNIEAQGCMNHNYLWPNLENVRDHCYHYHDCIDCQQDLIVRATLNYPSEHSDSCECSRKPSTTQSTRHPTTTTTTTTTPMPTTRKPTTSTTSVSRHFVCDKRSVVEFIALQQHTSHQRASPCDPSSGGSDDAYVLASCNATSPMTWRRGQNVMADCESHTHLIPGFTPISTFAHANYDALGSQSGVFLECYKSGFKMAIQKCNGVPEIVHVEHGAFTNNPRNYYAIVTY
ncbi:uncharacterized protein LOC132722339 isoform X1 [Ruditapes philippinarum]|uniref:uncharacterized protein LOC132722339 isoform X1 n=1 Tax=Ruditapes philippinarum TaxID=129788 RepID=UPI00295B6751|nr:uncharacterized protein LOC132722339 isoform X1 [Ruditapes philippinarum]